MLSRVKILPVIVVYNSSLKESEAYNYFTDDNIRKSGIRELLIFDNSPCPSINTTVLPPFVRYISDQNNPGLSYAYNCAAKYAKGNGYDWILLSDQDTIFPCDFFNTLIKSINDNPKVNLFIPKVIINNGKYLSPVPMFHYFSKPIKSAPNGMINPKKYGIINSGLLISLDAFFFVGGYNDRVSVDFADFQFIERYSNVFKEAYVVDVTCKQSFSNEGQTIEQKLTRYKMFCNSLKNYEPIKARNRLWISMVVIKRALSLCIESRKLSPLSFLIKYYLK